MSNESNEHRPAANVRFSYRVDQSLTIGLSGFRAGVTLVELLVVIVLVVIVGGAALTLYQLALRHSSQQQAVIEQTQNLRAALYTVGRDVRMAGNGLGFIGNQMVQIYIPSGLTDPNIQKGSGWFRYKDADIIGVRPVFGRSGGATGPDSLTIFRSDVEISTPLGRLESDYMPGSDNKITLKGIVAADTLHEGDMLAITQSTTTIIVQAGKFATSGKNTEITIGPRYKPEATLPGGLSIQQGSSVYNLRDVTFVTYYIDTSKNQLMASFLDGSIDNDDYDDQSRHAIIVANNIEDLQVAYYLNGVHYSGSAAADGYPELTAKQEISEADLSSDWIRGIKLSLVSISPIRSEAAGEGAPIKVMDHTIVGPADGHSRRILTENISLRNF